MAVAFNAQAFLDWTGTGGTFTLPVVASPRGVWVGIAQDPLITDQITSVSYGGGTLTRVVTNGFGTVNGGEPGAAYQYFRGQTLAASGTVNVVSVAGTFSAWAVAVDANQANTEIAASGMSNAATVTDPSVTLPSVSSDSGIAVGVVYSGVAAPTSIGTGTGYIALAGSGSGGRDFGAQSAGAEYGVKAGANVAVNWTIGSDDGLVVAALIREVPPTVLPPTVNFAIDVS